jgi:hypothetical protein
MRAKLLLVPWLCGEESLFSACEAPHLGDRIRLLHASGPVVHNEFRIHFIPKLAVEIAAVLIGVCIGFVMLARKDFAAWRK